jgi:hypothetical protein
VSITPRGMSIQEAYRLFRDGKLLVNRKYQRKLVWSEMQKSRLVDSILKGYPIPLLLLADQSTDSNPDTYEILDGIQRFNAIFSFIENCFPTLDGFFFDVSEFTRAKHLAEENVFTFDHNETKLLSSKQCANFLDYQLAITIYPATNDEEVTEVFGRINSGGKQLSPQERRQAGVITPFADMVRKLSAELRGDASREILLLSEMPEISIDTQRNGQGYGLLADEIFWCKQGILSKNDLRNGEDEEMVADIAASILLTAPIARSKELLDEIYNKDSDIFSRLERALSSYGSDRLSEEIKQTFSVLQEIINSCSIEPNYLRKIVAPENSNPIKTSFYTIFNTFFRLMVNYEQSPDNSEGIMNALTKLQSKLITSAHYATSEDRISNIDLTTGLIQKFFVKKEPPLLRHGPGLAIDFENSVRRSKIETTRYELKQGILRLSNNREFDTSLIERIIETICGIANLGPKSEGYIFIGVADKKPDADRISTLDNIIPIEINGHFVVGIEREAMIINKSIEHYLELIINPIKSSNLSEPLKTQVLSKIDIVDYKTFTIIRICIPPQKDISFVGNDAYIRQNSSTNKVEGRALLGVQALFQSDK